MISAIPLVSEELGFEKVILKGEIGDPANPSAGCRLNTRCPYAIEKCSRQEPPLVEAGAGRAVKCWLHA